MPDKSQRVRRGFTLVELILVMGVLALVAAMLMPALFRSLANQKLDKAADLVRTEMGRARVQAIRTGKIHALVYSVGANRLEVMAFDSLVNAQTNLGAGRLEQETRESDLDYSSNELPRDVLFVGGESKIDARSAFELGQGPDFAGQVTPLLFYPDGTSQDARVYLANRDGDMVMVTLRGLTGSSRIVRSLEETP